MQMYDYSSIDWARLIVNMLRLYDKYEDDWLNGGKDRLTDFIDKDLTSCFGGNGIPVACFTQVRERVRARGKYDPDREDFITYNLVAARLVVTLGLIAIVKKVLKNNICTLSYGTFKDDGTLAEMKYGTPDGVKTIFIDDLPITLFGIQWQQIEQLYLTGDASVILDPNKVFNSSYVTNQVISYNIHQGRQGLNPTNDYNSFQSICTAFSAANKLVNGKLLDALVD